MKRTVLLLAVTISVLGRSGLAQDAVIKSIGGPKAKIAIPDLRGAGETAQFMNVVNQTLFSDVQDSGLFEMAGKSLYPQVTPQQPSDFQEPGPTAAGRRAPWLTDWSSPPVSAKYLAFGYAGPQSNQIVLSGWLFDVNQATVAAAQVFGKRYFGPLDENGARKVAHEFAADIIAKLGGETLFGTHIYFVSDRSGHKEIWSMDYDGNNQKQVTRYNNTCITPSVSPDGSKLAFTTFAKGNPSIFVFSLETSRQLMFYNQKVSLNTTPNFTPDGKKILFASSANGYTNIFEADLDGSHMHRISDTRKIEAEPKVNPKTGADIVFVSGRSGPEQIWKMTRDGANLEMLTGGEGDAANPSWHPNGQIIAFAWTKGFEPGNWNIFLMDVASRQYTQLTHGAGRNENPNWGPDGRHLVFSSNRSGGKMQIFTMLADGTHVQQLTSQGRNEMPVWGK
jgi:TolB protein